MTRLSGEEKVIKCSHTEHLLSNLICLSLWPKTNCASEEEQNFIAEVVCYLALYADWTLRCCCDKKIIEKKKKKKKELMENLYNSSKESLF